MPREIEVKFPVENEKDLARRLARIGAKKTGEGLEHSEIFDNGTLRRKGYLLRLRRFGGKAKLTFKTMITQKEFKEAEETNLEVSNFDGMKQIIEKLGFPVFWIYEKKKTNYLLGRTKITIDRLPFATYMEIEGSRNEIRKAIKKLGLDPSKGITETYFDLYEKHCKEKGIGMGNLTFRKG